MKKPLSINKIEMFHAEVALVVAIFLQMMVWWVYHSFSNLQFFIILGEVAMLSVVAFSSNIKSLHSRNIYKQEE